MSNAWPQWKTSTGLECPRARLRHHAGPLGLNVARNTGVERSSGELVVFVDDDIRASDDVKAKYLHV